MKMRNTDKSNDVSDVNKEGLSMNEIAANVWLFFLAGFDSSSTTMSYTLFELAQNPELQEKARKNVEAVLVKYDNKITYEALQEMTYLEQCINETLRKYPPLPIITRRVSKDYKVRATNTVLEKDTTVFIPIYAIHHDPEYYPNPEEYNPDRFTPQAVQERNPFVFIPFGEGPRNCIGLRFGVMQAKTGLATLLMNFKFKVNKKTKVPVKLKNALLLIAEGGLHLDVEPISL